MTSKKLNIIGGGLAGAESAWQAAQRGIEVNLYEMRKAGKKTNAHQTDKIAELVCSNSFRNDDIYSAIGLLHEEMRRLNSLIMQAADATKLPAGSALAMDRDLFAEYIELHLKQHPNINIIAQEVTEIPNDGNWIIATGPLTSDDLTKEITHLTGHDKLAFFDAIAPIIYKDSIDFSVAWFQSRYDKVGPNQDISDGKDYINCPMDREQYYRFIDLLLTSEKTEFKEWEKNTPYFNGCLPIEVMAERGKDTLRFGPMKPVGLTNPNNTNKPYAVIQLRQDNKLGSLYNMVGFQTKLKYGLQKAVFSTIPGLENAEFARFGGLHRNTFINSPALLCKDLSMKNRKNIRFAGQITGVEGYVESAAIGLLSGIFATLEFRNKNVILPPVNSAIGSLLNHITGGAEAKTFQPMNINFGLMPEINIQDISIKEEVINDNIMPPLKKPKKSKLQSKQEKSKALSERALEEIQKWLAEISA